jgi:alkylhydroperoxidase family enzyme
MARVPYLSEEDLPPEYRFLFGPTNPFVEAEKDEDTESEGDTPWDGPQHTHRAIGNNPEILEAYRRLGASVWMDTGLNDRERELVILSVAKALESEYEWYQHVNVALRIGIDREALEALANDELESLSESERVLVEYATAFAKRSVDDGVHARLAEHFDDSTIVGIGMLAAYYIGIDYMGDALDLELEDEFVGWTLENV